MNYHLTEASKNKKTGPIPVVTVSKDTCPSSCPLKSGGGCYAESGPLAIHWRAVTKKSRGESFSHFIRRVRALPQGIWRYGQAGDLPGQGDVIDKDQLDELARANRLRPVIAFTHKPLTKDNIDAILSAEEKGFHINASADNVWEADDFLRKGVSVVVILSKEYARKSRKGKFLETITEYRKRLNNLPKVTPLGARIAVCPATYLDTTCQKCGICAFRRKNNTVIGFPAHGTKVNTIEERIISRRELNSE